jgi:hypothetical protein
MKKLLLLGLILAAGVARADTLTIQPCAGFGGLHAYYNCTTGTTRTVNIVLPETGYTSAQLWFDDQVVAGSFSGYWIGTYNGPGVMSVLELCSFQTLGGTAPCSLTGRTLQLTVDDSVRYVCVRQGRGQRCTARWTLNSATVVR